MDSVSMRWARSDPTLEQRERSLSWLSAGELVRVSASTERFLLGRMLVRELAAELDGNDPAQIVVTALCPDCGGPHGQPTIPGSSLRVSVAHCAGATVVVATRDRAIGVDIEPVAGGDRRLDAIGELTGIATLEHWTRVEAVLKADGRGLRVDPRSVVIEGQHARVTDRGIRYRLELLDLGPQFVASVAVAD